jgi:hypothetical protein
LIFLDNHSEAYSKHTWSLTIMLLETQKVRDILQRINSSELIAAQVCSTMQVQIHPLIYYQPHLKLQTWHFNICLKAENSLIFELKHMDLGGRTLSCSPFRGIEAKLDKVEVEALPLATTEQWHTCQGSSKTIS